MTSRRTSVLKEEEEKILIKFLFMIYSTTNTRAETHREGWSSLNWLSVSTGFTTTGGW